MDEPILSDKPGFWPALLRRRRFSVSFSRTRLVLIGCCLALVYGLTPVVLWAYNLERAGRAIAVGLAWPAPRQVDSLPTVRDDQALQAALGHLAAAARWRPGQPQSYRLAAQVYAARGDWSRATDELVRVRALEPRNPLPAWEQALIYEQMTAALQAAPRQNLLPDLASAPVEAPDAPVETTFCQGSDPRSCYVGLDTFTQPYADAPNGPSVTADVLFMYPPASVRLTHAIAPEQPVLEFLMGLDPNVRTWRSDGATFEIWVDPGDGQEQRIFSQTLDAAAARRGWVPGQVDLTPWASPATTLIFRTSGGPAGDTADDWYGWGNVTLTTERLAEYGRRSRSEDLPALLRAAGLDAAQLTARADEALAQDQAAAALVWYRRAAALEGQASGATAFRAATAALIAGQPDAAQPYVEQADVFPVGGRMRLPGPQLRWLRSGEQLARYPGDTPGRGMLWWGEPAAAIVAIEQPGLYRLTVRAQHRPPAPLQLQIEHNLAPIAQATLARGDGSWQSASTEVFLDRGRHLVGVRLLNDGADGIDRDGAVEWIELERSAGAP